MSALAFTGNSGGPLLNTAGAAIGVTSTLVGDMRGEGTRVPDELRDHMTVGVQFGAEMRALIEASQ